MVYLKDDHSVNPSPWGRKSGMWLWRKAELCVCLRKRERDRQIDGRVPGREESFALDSHACICVGVSVYVCMCVCVYVCVVLSVRWKIIFKFYLNICFSFKLPMTFLEPKKDLTPARRVWKRIPTADVNMGSSEWATALHKRRGDPEAYLLHERTTNCRQLKSCLFSSQKCLSLAPKDLHWENTQTQLQTSQMSNLASMTWWQNPNKNPGLFSQPDRYFVLWVFLFC